MFEVSKRRIVKEREVNEVCYSIEILASGHAKDGRPMCKIQESKLGGHAQRRSHTCVVSLEMLQREGQNSLCGWSSN